MTLSRRKVKGRGAASYIALPHSILESQEYAALGAFAVKLLIDLFSQFKGNNNSDFTAAWKFMKKRGWHSQDTLNRALKALLEAGWIVKTRQGGKHLCSLYAVTWLPIDACRKKLDVLPTSVASNDWKNKTVLRLPEHITTGGVANAGC